MMYKIYDTKKRFIDFRMHVVGFKIMNLSILIHFGLKMSGSDGWVMDVPWDL